MVIARIPVDKIASRVISKGYEFKPKIKDTPNIQTTDIPLPTYSKFPGPKKFDLTGKRIGNFKVIGFMGQKNQNMGVWLVRCDCGNYENMRSRAIKNPYNRRLMCRVCQANKKVTGR